MSRAVTILDETAIRDLVGPEEALEAVRRGFTALAEDHVSLPAILGLEFADADGEAHVKGAFIHGDPRWAVKVASGFYSNPARGLPVVSGLSMALSAETGLLEALLFDNGYLTDLRTGAAGALAADLLAVPEPRQVLIVGAGGQARYQLEALLQVRRPERVVVWARRPEAAAAYAAEMGPRLDADVRATDDLAAAASASDVIVTTTAASEPLLRGAWLAPGTHVTAMGSDFAGKRELDADVLRAATLVVADHPPAAGQFGETRAALAEQTLSEDDVVPLGDVLIRRHPGRKSEHDVTVCDLVGLGVQDAAIVAATVSRALERGHGTQLALP